MSVIEQSSIEANGLEFGYLAAGSGPLALCLHGFPDTAYSWRYLLPALAGAGFRAVAPFSRGYAPSGIPSDGCYHVGALVADAIALHDAFGGDENAILVGHDWGAMAAYGAASHAPDRWRRLVTAAVPPPPLAGNPFADYESVQRMAYIFFFQTALAEMVVPLDDFAYLRRLWEVWSPGFDPTEDVDHVRAALGPAGHLSAALGYYRALLDPATSGGRFTSEQDSAAQLPSLPTLYVHGSDDGCVPPVQGDIDAALPTGSKCVVLPKAGHFVHLEQPNAFNDLVLSFVSQ